MIDPLYLWVINAARDNEEGEEESSLDEDDGSEQEEMVSGFQ